MRTTDRLSFNIEEAIATTGLNKNALYRAIAANELQTFKVGKRRMVSARALQDYIARKEEEAKRSIAA